MKQLVNIWVRYNSGEERTVTVAPTSMEPEDWWFPIPRPRAATRIEFVDVEASGRRIQWYRHGIATLFPVNGPAQDVSPISMGYIKVLDSGKNWKVWANMERLFNKP